MEQQIIEKVYNYFCSRNPHLEVVKYIGEVFYSHRKNTQSDAEWYHFLRMGYLSAKFDFKNQMIILTRDYSDDGVEVSRSEILNQFSFSAVDQLGLIL